MDENPCFTSISDLPVEEFERSLPASARHGADLRFHGVVRETEAGRLIRGIDYSAYEPMAERELAGIVNALHEADPERRLTVHHRVGFVAAGEASLFIRVQTPHSADAFATSQECLRRIKASVPIWKRVVFRHELPEPAEKRSWGEGFFEKIRFGESEGFEAPSDFEVPDAIPLEFEDESPR